MKLKIYSLSHFKNSKARQALKKTKPDFRFTLKKDNLDIHAYFGKGISFDLNIFTKYFFYLELDVQFHYGGLGFQLYDIKYLTE